MACNVIVLYHVQHRVDNKTGRELKDKTPLMQGKFVERIAAYHSNFFEMVKKVNKETKKASYHWQTFSMNAPLKTDIPNCPHLVPATYKAFLKDWGEVTKKPSTEK